jgi:hypothetical protein
MFTEEIVSAEVSWRTRKIAFGLDDLKNGDYLMCKK